MIDQFSRVSAFLQEFSDYNNSKISLFKCQAFHISSNKNCLDKPFIDKGLNWPFEIIGIWGYRYQSKYVMTMRKHD